MNETTGNNNDIENDKVNHSNPPFSKRVEFDLESKTKQTNSNEDLNKTANATQSEQEDKNNESRNSLTTPVQSKSGNVTANSGPLDTEKSLGFNIPTESVSYNGKSDRTGLFSASQISANALKEAEILSKIQVVVEEPAAKQIYWPTSKKQPTSMTSHSLIAEHKKSQKTKHKNTEAAKPTVEKCNGKYTEIPHLLDGFRMLNAAGVSEDPEQVYALDLSRKMLEYVIEDDMLMFVNLKSLDVSENSLPFARLGILPALKKLNFSCNGLKLLDLEVDGRFTKLEVLDLSFNMLNTAAIIVLATLPKLKELNLTCNKLRDLPAQILDMTHWRDSVIELILPAQVAALDFQNMPLHAEPKMFVSNEDPLRPQTAPIIKLNQTNEQSSLSKPQTAQSEDIQYDGIDDDLLTRMIGFNSLEVLVLENNLLGAEIDSKMWRVLSQLPSLRILNLKNNKIKSLRRLFAKGLTKKSSEELLSMNKSTIPKFAGFYKLTELNVAQNGIVDLDHLLSIICLTKLQRVYVEGNPVMINFIPKHIQMKKSRNSQLASRKQFDLFSYLEGHHQIKISDACYQLPVSSISNEYISVKLSDKLKKPIIRKGPRVFLHKGIPSFQRTLTNPHVVEEVKLTKSHQIKTRMQRRRYQFTEEDLKFIVQNGKIPSIESLMKYADELEMDLESKDNSLEPVKEEIVDDMNDNSFYSMAQSFRNESLNYDSGKADDTFLTSVHITGRILTEPGQENSEYDYVDDPIEPEKTTNFTYDESEPEVLAELPSTILESVRALRIALRNPGLYWRQTEPKGSVDRNVNYNSQSKPKQEVKIKGTPSKTDLDIVPLVRETINRGQAAIRKPADEFEEMEALMKTVNDKMTEIENNFGMNYRL
ncbi:hypothetical protein BC833DRAFT_612361 [Globomyces pollinis-pini]|nr:hypothetical protein BC833DRAFT_612361 [Globomyces pollinis-pini]